MDASPISFSDMLAAIVPVVPKISALLLIGDCFIPDEFNFLDMIMDLIVEDEEGEEDEDEEDEDEEDEDDWWII
jgi:hypothetical protein